jgi:hypothetical protein
LTPTMVHYRPNWVPTTRSQKAVASGAKKPSSSRRSSKAETGDLKIRMVKWDRTTDRGTAPLNVEPRASGPRSCTLCSLIKRKVRSNSESAKYSANVQMAIVPMNLIPAQLAKRIISSANLLRLQPSATELLKPQPWKV